MRSLLFLILLLGWLPAPSARAAHPQEAFTIEAGTRYVVLVIHTDLPREALVMITPAGQLITPQLVDPIGSWQAENKVHLIQLESPAPGTWEIHNLSSDDSIELVVDPKLVVEPEFKFVTAGIAKDFRIALIDGSSKLPAADLIAALTFRAELFEDGDTPIRPLPLDHEAGAVRLTVPPLKAGQYRIHLYGGGLGFEVGQASSLLASGPVHISQSVHPGKTQLHIDVRDAGIDPASVKVVGQIAYPETPVGWLSGLVSGQGIEVPVNTSALQEGVPYRVALQLEGIGSDGKVWLRELDPLALEIEAPQRATPQHARAQQEALVASQAEQRTHEPSATEQARASEHSVEIAQASNIGSGISWGFIGVGHLLLLSGGWTFWRSRRDRRGAATLNQLLALAERLNSRAQSLAVAPATTKTTVAIEQPTAIEATQANVVSEKVAAVGVNETGDSSQENVEETVDLEDLEALADSAEAASQSRRAPTLP